MYINVLYHVISYILSITEFYFMIFADCRELNKPVAHNIQMNPFGMIQSEVFCQMYICTFQAFREK